MSTCSLKKEQSIILHFAFFNNDKNFIALIQNALAYVLGRSPDRSVKFVFHLNSKSELHFLESYLGNYGDDKKSILLKYTSESNLRYKLNELH